ncbi:MAG: hypothetical protein J6T44_05920 [Prevotella sp.]|nr:hypothetical protein [Prevotella sp.]
MDQNFKDNNTTVEVEAQVLRSMKAEELQLKLTMQDLADQLDDTQEELKATKESLRLVSKDLRDTRLQLHASIALQEKAEDVATLCEKVMYGFLMRWLTKKNQESVKTMLRFYHPTERVKMMHALLTYLLFGKKLYLEREVEQTHFRIICKKIDEDAITLPAHSLMVRLMQKYGLFAKIS